MNEKDQEHEDRALREFIDEIEEHPFGIVTRLGYQELLKKIDKHNSDNEKAFKSWLRRGLIAFSIIAITSSLALIGYGILLERQGNITNEIQNQRYNSFLDLCLDQNLRHDNVIKRIDEAVAQTPPPPKRQRRAKESAKPFKLILEAAVPYTRNCRKYARERTEGKTS